MRILLALLVLLVVGPAVPARADDWQWPVDGARAVSRPFAAPPHRYAAGHRGADLPSAPGASVRSAGAGVVSYAGMVAGRGVVAVVHGPLRTTYEPVTAVVEVGALVGAGEVVGVLEAGHAGCPAPACLHWGLRRGEDYLDPVRLVAPGPVRLLPLDAAVPAVSAVALRSAGGGAGSARRSADAALLPADAPVAGRAAAGAVPGRAGPGPPDPALPLATATVLGAAAVGVARRGRG